MKARYLWVPAVLYFALVALRGHLAGWAEADAEQRLEEQSSVPEAFAPPIAGEDPSFDPAAVPAPAGYVLRDVVSARVTAYEPSSRSCGKFADGVTSIGRDAFRSDGVAIAPQAIPYGALVFVPGAGFRQTDDTGSAMVNAWRRHRQVHIDVRMQSVAEALEWGVREDVPVHVFLRQDARAQRSGEAK